MTDLTIVAETENNSLTVTTPNGNTHPAWGTSYDLATNVATPMSVTSNTFCAGGFSLANGSWAVFGGNQPTTYQGVAVKDKTNNPSGASPYDDQEGGEAIRMLTPCDDGSCQWQEGGAALTMTVGRRPAIRETLLMTRRASGGTLLLRGLRMGLSSFWAAIPMEGE